VFDLLRVLKWSTECRSQWLSLEIHERCPASGSLKDPANDISCLWSVCLIKGGKILQDRQCGFLEQSSYIKFVVDAELSPPHLSVSAPAMFCEVQAKVKCIIIKPPLEIALQVKIQVRGDPQKLSQAIGTIVRY
jgi:hypothetical protein